MTQKRKKRGGIEDRWQREDGNPTVRNGQGLRWLARIVDENWVDEDGRKVGKEYTKSFRVQPPAKEWLASQIAALETGKFVSPRAGQETIAERAELYVKLRGLTKPKSIESVRSLLDSQVLPRWGQTELRHIEEEEVGEWVSDLTEAGLSSSRTRQSFHLLQAIMKAAVRKKLIPFNPCEEVRLPKLTTKHGHRFLTMTQVQDLAAACGDDGDIVQTLALTGIRWGELVALRVSSIDREARRLVVDASTSEVKGILSDGPPKNWQRRSVSVPRHVMDLLIKRSRGKLPGARLFTTANGAILRSSNFRRDVYDAAVASVEAMWERLTIHELRHSYASLANKEGVKPFVISRNLGHKNLAVTYSIYVGMFDGDLDESGDLLGAAFAASLAATAD